MHNRMVLGICFSNLKQEQRLETISAITQTQVFANVSATSFLNIPTATTISTKIPSYDEILKKPKKIKDPKRTYRQCKCIYPGCHLEFTSERLLRIHFHSNHNYNILYCCRFCQKGFENLNGRAIHEAAVHKIKRAKDLCVSRLESKLKRKLETHTVKLNFQVKF